MRKLHIAAAALCLTGLAACDQVMPGSAPVTTLPAAPQQGERQGSINPALLAPSELSRGGATAGITAQQGQDSRPALNPAQVPSAELARGAPTAGITPQQGEGGRPAINPALLDPRRPIAPQVEQQRR